MSMHEADGRRDEEQPYGPPPAGPAYRQEMPIIGPDGLQDRVPHRGPNPDRTVRRSRRPGIT